MSFSLKLLGGVALFDASGPLTGPAVQRHRLALLALLAASPGRAQSRDKLMAWLWPERDGEHARRLLNQGIHALRRALGAQAILSAGEELQFNARLVACDVVGFEETLARGDAERAVALYAGPLLDGFFLDDAPEFDRWVERERDRLAAAYARALEGLAEAAEREGDTGTAAKWWKARAAHDPYDSGAALRFMQALVRAGNRAGAIQHAAAHQQLLREDLEIDPPAELRALVEQLRREPAAKPAAKKPRTEGAADRTPAADAPALPPTGPLPGSRDSGPERRRTLWYGAAVMLLGAVLVGTIRLTVDRGEAPTFATRDVVDEIAQAVARELTRREQGDTVVRLPQHRTLSIPAYELYLRGNDPALLRSDSTARLGLDYFRRAVALDSSYAAGWAGLARMAIRVSIDEDPSSRTRSRALAGAAATKAVALDDSLAEAHATLGLVRMGEYRLSEAEQHLRRAISLDPGVALHREWLVKLYLWTRRVPEALAEARRALELAPLSPSATAELARVELANGQCDDALARLETIADLDPPLQRAPGIAAQCYARKGMWSEAIAAVRPKIGRAGAERSQSLGTLGYLLARSGQRDEATRVLAELQDPERTEGGSTWPVALVFLGMGDLDQAVPWLNRAVDDGSLIPWAEPLPLGITLLDSLRGDSRIALLLLRLGLQKR